MPSAINSPARSAVSRHRGFRKETALATEAQTYDAARRCRSDWWTASSTVPSRLSNLCRCHQPGVTALFSGEENPMTQKSGLAAVLAAITGKQPAGDSTIPRADHMTAIEAAVTQAFGEGETAARRRAAATAEATLAVTAERARIKAHHGGEHAKGREALARISPSIPT
jgi:hypothetical protein